MIAKGPVTCSLAACNYFAIVLMGHAVREATRAAPKLHMGEAAAAIVTSKLSVRFVLIDSALKNRSMLCPV